MSILLLLLTAPLSGATIRVPEDRPTIQAAIDVAAPGDVVLVAAGRYRERLTLRPGVTVRSAGDDARGELGLRRAEATILDGGGAGEAAGRAGVTMAPSSVLDGLTVTGVGEYDESTWRRHFDSQGEELGDDEGAAGAEGTVPAVRAEGCECVVRNNIVHHNGDVGIAVVGGGTDRDGEDSRATITAIVEANHAYRNLGGGIGVALGAAPVVRSNVCRENLRAGIGCRAAAPLIVDNECSGNVRAGIGCREGSTATIRGNRCHHNRRAGIGVRMEGTRPVVEGNDCHDNSMAGIGCRDLASPVIRDNRCHHNELAGIGCDGASPLIVGNDCQENAQAGIGVRGAARARLLGNTCRANKLVAIGVVGGATAWLHDNILSREGGAPPLVAVREGATATLVGNRLSGGGVAAILLQGNADIRNNAFQGNGPGQGNAIWIQEGSTAVVADNRFAGYRSAIRASKAAVTITGNHVAGFQGTAIVVQDSPRPAHVHGNRGAAGEGAKELIEVKGAVGVVDDNELVAGGG